MIAAYQLSSSEQVDRKRAAHDSLMRKANNVALLQQHERTLDITENIQKREHL